MNAMRIALASCILATGCATMVNGTHQTLALDSSPAGAAVEVECADASKIAAITPAKIEVPRAADHCRVTFTRDGYETKIIELSHQQSRATVLNTAFGIPSAVLLGLVGAFAGATVDGADTGAEIGAEVGFDVGSSGATALDKKGGGWKWVPGDIFVVLYRSAPETR